MNTNLSLTVAKRTYLTKDICQFEFRDPRGAKLPQFTAGAHVKVVAPNGAIRSYSLNNDEIESDRYVISVKRDDQGRGGSQSMHSDLSEGDLIEVSPPKNELEFVSANKYLLIAGGIGVTPILSMFKKLVREGNRNFHLIYSSRTPEDAAFLDELAHKDFEDVVTIHHSATGIGGNFDFWPFLARPDETHIYYCGPKPMMDAIYAQTIHWPRSAIHFEDFAGVTSLGIASTAFKVRRQETGELIDVPADRTIVETFRALGLKPLSSCESGTCGTCRVRLIAGDPDHRDLYLSSDERSEYFIPCVSRSFSDEICLDM